MIEIWFLYFTTQDPATGAFRYVYAGEYQTEERCEIGALNQLPFAKVWISPDVGWICKKEVYKKI